jgi:DNA polymerase V
MVVYLEKGEGMSRVALLSGLRLPDELHGLPLFLETVAAGFPSPAGDYIECRLDLNEHLIRHPSSTFFVRVAGDSMIGAGIHDGDILIVDRSLEPVHGSVVVAALNGELTVKRLVRQDGRCALKPENDSFRCVDIPEQADFTVWGVATSVIHKL